MGKFSHQIQWDLTRSVTLANIFYFLYNGGKACLFPFLTLYYRSLGLTATQTGLICGSKSFIWYFATPVWLMLATRTQKIKIVLGVSLLFAIGTNLSITLVPSINQDLFMMKCNFNSMDLPSDAVHMNTTPYVIIGKSGAAITFPSTTATKKIVFPNETDVSRVQITSATAKKKNTTMLEMALSTDKLESLEIIPQSLALSMSTQRLITAPFSTTTPPTTTSATLARTLAWSTTTSMTTATPAETLHRASATKLSSYRLAQLLLLRVVQDNPQTPKDLVDLVSRYKETRNLSVWKQRAVVKNIIKLLDTRLHEDTNPESIRQSMTNKPALVTTTVKTVEVISDFAHSIAQSLVPFYWKEKEKYPFLTVSRFIKNYPELTSFSTESKQLIIRALENEIKKSNVQRRSISNDDMVPNSNETNNNVTGGVSNVSHAFKALMKSVYLNLTNNSTIFLTVFVIIVIGEVMAAPVDVLSDFSFYELLDELDSVDKYGKHKVFGLIGIVIWGLLISVAVYLSPCFVAGTITRFNLHFYGFSALVGLSFLVVPFFPTYSAHSNRQSRGTNVAACPTCAGRMCCDSRRFLLLLTIFIVGVVQAGMHDFMLWGIQDLSGSSELVYGSYVSAGALCSLLAVPFGRRMMSSFKPNLMVPFSLICIATQLFLFSCVSLPWLIVPLQLFNIAGIPFLWVVISCQINLLMSWQDDTGMLRRVDEVHVFAKASKKRAVHTAYLATYQGLAFGFGSIFSGVAYDLAGKSLGPYLRVGSIIIFVWAFVYLLYHCCCVPHRKHKKYSKLLEDSEDDEDIFSMKDEKPPLGFSKYKRGAYVHNGKRRNDFKKRKSKKREEIITSSSSDGEELKHDWFAMAMRQDSQLL